MQYNAVSPKEYIAQLNDDWRHDTLQQLRTIIKSKAPELEECVNYKMLGYRSGEHFVFHLNAQKGYVSLYVGNASKIDPSGELVKGLNVGKGCIRFSKSKSVPETRIDEFLELAIQRWRQGMRDEC